MKVVIFGNSGSGKSTLAKRLSKSNNLPHLDLDLIAWTESEIPERRPVDESKEEIDHFTGAHECWVIEGCYSDLLEIALEEATEVVFLNLPIEACIENAKNRPWEPHKYTSKEAQDANLKMLIDWISQYAHRDDTFSRSAHERLYDDFEGTKRMYTCNRNTH